MTANSSCDTELRVAGFFHMLMICSTLNLTHVPFARLLLHLEGYVNSRHGESPGRYCLCFPHLVLLVLYFAHRLRLWLRALPKKFSTALHADLTQDLAHVVLGRLEGYVEVFGYLGVG